MTKKIQIPLTPKQLGERIIRNLNRAQGYLDVLSEEIKDPNKIGPGTEKAEWDHLTLELREKLNRLDEILKATDWE